MAEATVFVDDAVRGTLPQICVKDGVPTTDQLRFSEQLGDQAGFGVAWLLLLAGPLGWIGLLILSGSKSGRAETLTVQLPLSAAAYERLRAARRVKRVVLGGACLAGALLMLVASAGGGPLGRVEIVVVAALAVAAMIGVVVTDGRVRGAGIGLDLDASRRWVTIHDVHPSFATAYAAADQRERR